MSAPADQPWQRLHPLSPVVQLGRSLVAVVAILLLPYLVGPSGHSAGNDFDLVVVTVTALGGLVSWLVTRWRVEGGTLRVNTGLVRRQHRQVPLARIQSIDIIRPFLARIFGLAELRVRTGVARGGDARLAFLSLSRAELVRRDLLDWSQAPSDQLSHPIEVTLAKVRSWRLLLAVWLQGTVPLELVATVGLLIASHSTRGVVGRVCLSAAGALLLMLLLATARRLNAQWLYSVASVPDGLLIQGGMVGTVSETLPKRRIQAIRIVEPLLWRPMGWIRLEVDVAGGQRRKGEDRGVAGRLRLLLPVATWSEATAILSDLAPGLARPGSHPPSRVHWKAPLSYHFLAASLGSDWIGASTGRWRRTTIWAALSRVQSVRWSQGPLQRRMRLANVHLDVVGRSAKVSLRDREVGEARLLVQELPARCRQASTSDPSSRTSSRPRLPESSG